MPQATFHFYGSLNDFLLYRRRDVAFPHTFEHVGSIKDMIESLGVPHPEIDVITVNSVSVDFDYLVQAEDQIGVYPFFWEVDVQPVMHLRPEPLPEARFVLDTHLGKLANLLRMLGFDTLYSNRFEDDELAEISSREQRILLTRDLGVLKRGIVRYGYFVRQTDPQQQIGEILRRYDLLTDLVPFRRCMACNGLLHPVDKAQVWEQLSDSTRQYYDEFHQCEACGKIYWKGSHYDKMQAFIQDMLK